MTLNKYIKILILSVILLVASSNISNASTIKMVINGGTKWNYTTVSNSYAQCEALNDSTSTLGTQNLNAHLSTVADWSAMAIFSASQFGAANSNLPGNANPNASGVCGILNTWTGDFEHYQTTGIYMGTTKTSNNGNFASLFDENGNIKKYVKMYNTLEEEQQEHVWLKNASEGGTSGFFNTYLFYSDYNSRPGIKVNGLFGIACAHPTWQATECDGGSYSNVSFRPVLWNSHN